MKTGLYLMLSCFVATCATFVSCSNEELITPVELKTVCKQYKHDKIFLVLNGDTLHPSVDAVVNFPDGNLPELDIYESKMVLETTPPWLGADGNLWEVPNLKFDVDVSSSSEEVSFVGTTSAYAYLVDVKGIIRNDSVWMDMTYQTKNNKLEGKTFELEMSADSYLLKMLKSNVTYQDTVVWNGTTYSTADFVRESLDVVFQDYVAKTGIDAYRMTFDNDGKIELKARNAENGLYTSVDGHLAYRFHKGYEGWGGGVFEVGMEQAKDFYFNFVDDLNNNPHFPNQLFQTYMRDRAYIPISLREIYYTIDEDNVEERLYLELVAFDDNGNGTWYSFAYFLSDMTKLVTDYSDKTMRLRKIMRLIDTKKIADEFLFYMKEVKE